MSNVATSGATPIGRRTSLDIQQGRVIRHIVEVNVLPPLPPRGTGRLTEMLIVLGHASQREHISDATHGYHDGPCHLIVGTSGPGRIRRDFYIAEYRLHVAVVAEP
jgi:hypothetical protein